MRCSLLTLTLAFITTGLRANVHIPKARLAGETVSVVLSAESATVTGVYQFEEWLTRDEKIAYFPIYSSDRDAIRTLSASQFEFRIGQKQGIAVPCAAPRRYSAPPSGVYVHWYCIRFDDVADDGDAVPSESPTVIRVSYIQPLVGGCFYYLPVIPGWDFAKEMRAWNFQLHARSAVRRLGVQSQCDHEFICDSVTIYLRDDQPVVLE